MNKYSLALVLLISISASSHASIITLDFEGIASYPNDNDVLILDYYNGGTASNGNSGINYGVEFSSDAYLICLNTQDVYCSNSSRGGSGLPNSQLGAMFFLESSPFMNVSAGFDTGFSMSYSNPFSLSVGIEIYDDINATGNLLASSLLSATTNGESFCLEYDGPNYCPFSDFSISFSGTARSILFTGIANRSVYDDFTFGSTSVGGVPTSVPEPSSLLLIGLGLLAAFNRKTRNKS